MFEFKFLIGLNDGVVVVVWVFDYFGVDEIILMGIFSGGNFVFGVGLKFIEMMGMWDRVKGVVVLVLVMVYFDVVLLDKREGYILYDENDEYMVNSKLVMLFWLDMYGGMLEDLYLFVFFYFCFGDLKKVYVIEFGVDML